MAKPKRSGATSKQTKISQNEPAASMHVDTNNGSLPSVGIVIVIIAILFFFGIQIMSALLLIVIVAAVLIYWMTPSDVTGSAFPGNNVDWSSDLDFDDQNQGFDQSHLGSSAAPPGEVSSGPSRDNKQPPTTKSKQSKNKPQSKPVDEDDEDDSDD